MVIAAKPFSQNDSEDNTNSYAMDTFSETSHTWTNDGESHLPASGQLPLYDEDMEPEDALDEFLKWVESRDIELWPHQEEALFGLAAGNHVILGTPTGSGKSLVALGMLYLALCAGKVAYYTAPIKALVNEKFFALCEVFGSDNVGMMTGDATVNPSAPIICATAEILANKALREGE